MHKNIIILCCVLALAGCTYGQDYLEDPGSFVRDPHYANYVDQRDELELRYLRKEIAYAEYIQAKDELDATYEEEVQERNKEILFRE